MAEFAASLAAEKFDLVPACCFLGNSIPLRLNGRAPVSVK